MSADDVTVAVLRSANLIEGIWLAERSTVRGITVSPIVPGLGQDTTSLFNGVLKENGFSTVLAQPTWMASYGARHRLVSAITPAGRFTEPPGAWIQLNALVTGAVDVLAIRQGGAPRLVGSVVERHDGSQWQTMMAIVGGAPWSTSHLSHAVSDYGAVLPQLDCDDASSYILERPRVGLWLHLFTSILSEGDINIRALRLYGLLESIATGAPRRILVQDLDGTRLYLPNHDPVTTDSNHGKVLFLILSACKYLSVASGVFLTYSEADISKELGIWKDIRDVIAHEGVWLPSPHVARLRNQQQSIEKAATVAANGDSLERGFEKYVSRMTAACEAVLRCLLARQLSSFI